MTREQAVLERLIDGAKGESFTYYGKRIPEYWVPLNELVNEKTGGSEGTRRIRRIREKGVRIDMMDFSVEVSEDGNLRSKRTFLYRLLTPLERIDPVKCCLIKKKDASTGSATGVGGTVPVAGQQIGLAI